MIHITHRTSIMVVKCTTFSYNISIMYTHAGIVHEMHSSIILVINHACTPTQRSTVALPITYTLYTQYNIHYQYNLFVHRNKYTV